jgi:hypothetical protein
VDPTIGDVELMLVPTRPHVHMLNSMRRVYPNRKDQLDQKIRLFPFSIVSLMPRDNDKPRVWDQEITTPDCYSTLFVDAGVITAERVGFCRFTFPNGKATLRLKNILSLPRDSVFQEE